MGDTENRALPLDFPAPGSGPPDGIEGGERVYTVSDVTRLVRDHLESQVPPLRVTGEISDLHTAGSGHRYFLLKDSESQLACVLFRSEAARLKFALEDGLQVVAFGTVGIYVRGGRYQYYVRTLDPSGRGALQLAFEQLRKRLAAEGLFDASRKRPLPFLPRRIAIATSPSGAALRDIVRVIFERFPGADVLVVPTRVQGEGSAGEIAAAVRATGAQSGVDLLIVGRGGGSVEDLWAFNEEAVVRAIAGSPVPVISAVGHEIDFTLADFAADCRAATPTGAGELAVPEAAILQRTMREYEIRLTAAARRYWATAGEKARVLRRSRPLAVPGEWLADRRQRLDESTAGLHRAGESSRRIARVRFRAAAQAVRIVSPIGVVRRKKQALIAARAALTRAGSAACEKAAGRWKAAGGRLRALDPFAVLDRGFSLTMRWPEKSIVRDSHKVSVGDRLRVRLGRGALGCAVEEVIPAREQEKR